jgi:hypothetical protein
MIQSFFNDRIAHAVYKLILICSETKSYTPKSQCSADESAQINDESNL